jgi:hypothetical protein
VTSSGRGRNYFFAQGKPSAPAVELHVQNKKAGA